MFYKVVIHVCWSGGEERKNHEKPMKPPLPAQGFIPSPHSATPQARSQVLHEEIQAQLAAYRIQLPWPSMALQWN